MRLTGSSRNRYGRRGWTKPAGLGTSHSWSTKWSISGIVRPLPIGATGIRISDAISTISAVVRAVDHSRITGTSSAERRRRSMAMNSDSSSVHAGCSISAQKSSHCWPVMTKNPTWPSDVGSMPGTGTPRSWWNGVAAIDAYVTGYMLCSRWAASSCEASSSSPMPVARTRGNTPSSAATATAPANHGVGSPPAISGARVDITAWCHAARHGLQDEVRRWAIGPWAVQPEGRDRDRCQLRMASVQLLPRVWQSVADQHVGAVEQ